MNKERAAGRSGSVVGQAQDGRMIAHIQTECESSSKEVLQAAPKDIAEGRLVMGDLFSDHWRSGPRTASSGLKRCFMHFKMMIAPSWKFGKELLLFCGGGGLCGVGIGFIMFLHLGPFKSPEDAGYAAGLFVKSGVQLGFFVWIIHVTVLALRHWVLASRKNMP